MNLYDPATAPSVFEVVWCKWPRREDKLGPGPWVRCVLVLDVRPMIDQRTNKQFAAITAAYGTGAENVSVDDLKQHLYIMGGEFAALGLHKPTVFKLDLQNRKRLAWSEEYFVPQAYLKQQNIVAGSLNEHQRAHVLAYFEKHGLEFPLP